LALLVLYAVRDLGLTPAQLGLVYAIATAGPILASAAAGPATRRFGFGWMSVAAAALFAGNLLVPLAAGPPVLVLAFLVAGRGLVGLGAVFLSITRTSVLQDSVPPDLVGRVNAVVHLVEWGPLPLGSLLGGLLGQAIGLRPALFILATAGMAAVPWVLVVALRRAGDRSGSQR
jgi:MFS family permease